MAQLLLNHGKVALKVKATPDTTDGGVLLPDAVKKMPQEGVVTHVGPGRYVGGATATCEAETFAKVGDRVFFSKYGGTILQIDGEELTVIDEDQIYLVMRG